MASPFHMLDLSRRAVLRGAAFGAGAGLLLGGGLASGARAAVAKLTQKAANYQATPRGNQRCNTCSQWVQPTSCKVVEGIVSPTGWCSLFAPKW
jgi:hypothetical protein